MKCVTPTVHSFFHKDSSTCTHVAYDPSTKDGVLIDPVTDLDMVNWQASSTYNQEVAAWITANGIKLHAVMDTHTHADHITGGAYFADKFHVPYCIGDKITGVQSTFAGLFDLKGFPCAGAQFGRLLKAEEEFMAGTLSIRCIPTNGHTPNCLSYHIGDAVFTGDALFIEDFGTGRCDFPGGSAADLYDSLMRLYALPGETRVFVGHDYQPGGRPLRVESTIGVEREKNEDMTIRATKEEFVAMKQKWDATLNLPKMIFPSLLANMNGGKLPEPHPNGHRYFVIPMNIRQKTNDIGEAQK